MIGKGETDHMVKKTAKGGGTCPCAWGGRGNGSPLSTTQMEGCLSTQAGHGGVPEGITLKHLKVQLVVPTSFWTSK